MKRASAFPTFRFFVFGVIAVLALPAASVQAQQIDPGVRKLLERERRVKDVVKKVSKSVVALTDGMGWGSGVIVSEDGLIVTAGHVSLEARGKMYAYMPDGRRYEALCLGRNLKTDAALLLLNRDRQGRPISQDQKWPAVELGNSASLRRGDWTVSMGHPLGLKKNRPAPVRVGRILSIGSRTIVTDGTIIVGDSGGPVFDLRGRLVGIHSMIGNDITNNRHVAIDVIRRDWARMEDKETWGKLGDFDTGLVASSLFGTKLDWDMYEAKVEYVIARSPADRGGIRAGDRLVSVDGQAIADALELSLILGERNSGDLVTTEVERGRDRVTLQVRLGQFPDVTKDELLPRRRSPGIHEKAHRFALAEFRPVTNRNKGATVRFVDSARPDKQLALGAVVSRDGYVVTKYSELDQSGNLMCELSNGRLVQATIVAYEERFDICLVEIKARGLKPIDWQEAEPAVGQLLVSPSHGDDPVATGVVSVPARELDEPAFLGVQVGSDRNRMGANVVDVVEDSAAERMGLLKDDWVLELNGRTIRSHSHLVDRIKTFKPGDKVRLKVERQTGRYSQILEVDIALSSKFVAGDWRQKFQDQNMLGTKISDHSTGFPGLVLQHDTVLDPNECGGPLLNVEGKAVGINIARAGRVLSYAIPAREARKLINELINKVK